MFCLNKQGTIERKQARRDVHGREFFDDPVVIELSVIKLKQFVETSSVRADQTASRGSADQTVMDAMLLVAPTLAITAGDVIEVDGYRIEVSGIHPRYDVLGNFEHKEITGNIKGQK